MLLNDDRLILNWSQKGEAAPNALTDVERRWVLGVLTSGAGSAAAMSEAASDLGYSLGIAVLGSIAGAGYRFALDLPAGLPSERHTEATESLVGATSAAESLDPAAAESLVAAAREAFLSGADIALGVVAALLAGLAVLVHRLLAHLPPTTTQQPH